MGKKIVAYIRGGLGDVWPAVSAIKSIMDREKINKQYVFVLSDSVYYFRDYSQQLSEYSIQMLHKLTNNIITIPPCLNDNFWLRKNGKIFDDTTSELSQEEADKYINEFMFWRPNKLKNFVSRFIDKNTIFIDALFTECIVVLKEGKFERIGNERAVFEFNPPQFEKSILDGILEISSLVIHVRKKNEGDSYRESSEFYNKIIKWCNENNIMPILIGTDKDRYEGKAYDLRGSNILSFEGMAYLIDKCKIMLGNDSGFSAIKLYQQQKDKLLIMNYPRWERNSWYFRPFNGSENVKNCLLLNANEDNFIKITKTIKEFYGR